MRSRLRETIAFATFCGSETCHVVRLGGDALPRRELNSCEPAEPSEGHYPKCPHRPSHLSTFLFGVVRRFLGFRRFWLVLTFPGISQNRDATVKQLRHRMFASAILTFPVASQNKEAAVKRLHCRTFTTAGMKRKTGNEEPAFVTLAEHCGCSGMFRHVHVSTFLCSFNDEAGTSSVLASQRRACNGRAGICTQ